VGAAEVQGIQSRDVIAVVKHFIANSQETNRMTDSSYVSERTLEEIYAPQYETAVKQCGAGAVMCSLNRINSVYACENPSTLGILDDQFGFTGFVISDWGGTHSTVASAKAGLDMEMNTAPGTYYGSALQTAVQDGQVPMATLDDMVLRILRLGHEQQPDARLPPRRPRTQTAHPRPAYGSIRPSRPLPSARFHHRLPRRPLTSSWTGLGGAYLPRSPDHGFLGVVFWRIPRARSTSAEACSASRAVLPLCPGGAVHMTSAGQVLLLVLSISPAVADDLCWIAPGKRNFERRERWSAGRHRPRRDHHDHDPTRSDHNRLEPRQPSRCR
jgi:hypothetical protein